MRLFCFPIHKFEHDSHSQMKLEHQGKESKECLKRAKQQLSWGEWLELVYYRYTLESAVYMMTKEDRWIFNAIVVMLMAIIVRGTITWIRALFL